MLLKLRLICRQPYSLRLRRRARRIAANFVKLPALLHNKATRPLKSIACDRGKRTQRIAGNFAKLPWRDASKRPPRSARNLNFKPHWNYNAALLNVVAEQRTLPGALSLGPRNLCMAISGSWPRTIANTEPAGRGHTRR